VSQYISTISEACAVRVNWRFKRTAVTDAYLHRNRQTPREPRIRQPATIKLIRAVFSDRTIDIGVRTAALLAYSTLLRASEYTSPSAHAAPGQATLRVRDVKFSSDGTTAALRIPHSKSDVYNQGCWVHVMASDNPRFCPVKALRDYVRAHPSGGEPDSPLFLRRSGTQRAVCVTPADVSQALKTHAAAAGLDPDLVSTHSLRIGGAFELADAGVDWETIGVMGRWSQLTITGMKERYARMSVQRKRNAARALDLSKPRSAWARPLL
jgi:hypothetical protein